MVKLKKKAVVEDVEIIDTALKGRSLGKVDNAVVFVEGVVPGDVVDVQIIRKKKKFFEGKPLNFKKYSEFREEPFCKHFDYCGGCKWQNITYEKQLFQKEKMVRDNLQRVAGVDAEIYLPIIPSAKTKYYRNRLDFAFSDKRWLTPEEIKAKDEINDRDAVGFHVPGRFDKVLDIEHCYLQDEPTNAIRLALKAFLIEKGYSFYDILNKKGLLRSLIIRTSSTGEIMVIVMFGEQHEEQIEDVMSFLKAKFTEITSWYYVINEKANDTFFDLELKLYDGNPYLTENLDGIQLQLGPKSFYQTNSSQALTLFNVARDFAEIQPNETVYDLYTGVGSIGLFIANQAKHVVGVETVPEAIEYAKHNAKINGITNTSFYAGEVEDLFTEEFIDKNGHPDVIIVDPPRSGMHPKVVKKLAEVAPERIVYVSCNPSTQARDVELLKEQYDFIKAQPVDMFPHTYHVENVLLLKKKEA